MAKIDRDSNREQVVVKIAHSRNYSWADISDKEEFFTNCNFQHLKRKILDYIRYTEKLPDNVATYYARVEWKPISPSLLAAHSTATVLTKGHTSIECEGCGDSIPITSKAKNNRFIDWPTCVNCGGNYSCSACVMATLAGK